MGRSRGSIALEFLLLFPMVIALLYGAATYGVLVYQKYEMQSLVNQAAALSTRIDRSQSGSVVDQVLTLSNSWLTDRLPKHTVSDRGCQASETDSASLECFIEWEPEIRQISVGFLGAFPPLPDNGRLRVKALMPF